MNRSYINAVQFVPMVSEKISSAQLRPRMTLLRFSRKLMVDMGVAPGMPIALVSVLPGSQ